MREMFTIDPSFALAPSVALEFGSSIQVEFSLPTNGQVALCVDPESAEALLYRPDVDVPPFKTRHASGRQMELKSLEGFKFHGTVVG
jgi:hypothetical protein